jgi:two-component system, OmpR family, phosphate regulon sensor histidine kinase PhoR
MPEDLQAKQDGNIVLKNPMKSREISTLPIIMIGDERRLKQVLINLVKNAKKFTDAGCIEIKVSYNVANSSLVVHVKDTGVGIDKKDLPKLFNKFGKLKRTA